MQLEVSEGRGVAVLDEHALAAADIGDTDQQILVLRDGEGGGEDGEERGQGQAQVVAECFAAAGWNRMGPWYPPNLEVRAESPCGPCLRDDKRRGSGVALGRKLNSRTVQSERTNDTMDW